MNEDSLKQVAVYVDTPKGHQARFHVPGLAIPGIFDAPVEISEPLRIWLREHCGWEFKFPE